MKKFEVQTTIICDIPKSSNRIGEKSFTFYSIIEANDMEEAERFLNDRIQFDYKFRITETE